MKNLTLIQSVGAPMRARAYDQRINAMQPGASIEISRTNSGRCTAERSGDGKTLLFVRHTRAGFVVFRTESF